jgi:hypothetical protein
MVMHARALMPLSAAMSRKLKPCIQRCGYGLGQVHQSLGGLTQSQQPDGSWKHSRLLEQYGHHELYSREAEARRRHPGAL